MTERDAGIITYLTNNKIMTLPQAQKMFEYECVCIGCNKHYQGDQCAFYFYELDNNFKLCHNCFKERAGTSIDELAFSTQFKHNCAYCAQSNIHSLPFVRCSLYREKFNFNLCKSCYDWFIGYYK